MTTKVLNTKELIQANSKAKDLGRNRYLSVSDVDPEGVHVVFIATPHGDDSHVRCGIFIKLLGSDLPYEGWLDMEWEDYRNLSEEEIPT